MDKGIKDSDEPEGFKSWKIPKHFSGWRAGALLSCLLATIVISVNAIVIVHVQANYKVTGGTAALYAGSCHKTSSMNTVIQLAVNIL